MGSFIPVAVHRSSRVKTFFLIFAGWMSINYQRIRRKYQYNFRTIYMNRCRMTLASLIRLDILCSILFIADKFLEIHRKQILFDFYSWKSESSFLKLLYRLTLAHFHSLFQDQTIYSQEKEWERPVICKQDLNYSFKHRFCPFSSLKRS